MDRQAELVETSGPDAGSNVHMKAEGRSTRRQTPPTVREDPTGKARAALRRLIAEGSEIECDLRCPGSLALDALDAWRSQCAKIVRATFEQEALAELARALSGPPRAAARPQNHGIRVRNALELLEALEGTLDRRGGKGHAGGRRT